MKYSKAVKQLKKENEQLAEALQPLTDAGLIKDENLDEITTLDEE